MVLDAGQLDDKLVDRGVSSGFIALALPPLKVNGCRGGPEPLTVRAAVGERPCDTYRSDGIKLVSVEDDLGLQGGGLWVGSEAMSRNSVRHRVELSRGHPCEELSGTSGADGGVVTTYCLSFRPTDIVEKNCCSHDQEIGTLGLRDPLGKSEHAQDVIEVVDGIGFLV